MAHWSAPLTSAVCYVDPQTAGQTVESVTREQAEQAGGLKITGWV
jgi:hypothetical protein